MVAADRVHLVDGGGVELLPLALRLVDGAGVELLALALALRLVELLSMASSGRCRRLHAVDAAGVELHQVELLQAVPASSCRPWPPGGRAAGRRAAAAGAAPGRRCRRR